jgi:hypothetical protein
MSASAENDVASALKNAYLGGPAADDARMASLIQSPAQAYAVQDALVRALDQAQPGAYPSTCWKSGGPSRDATLTNAQLPAWGVRPSGSSLQGLHLRRPAFEAEIALRIGRTVDASEAGTLTHESAIELVDAMCVTIEVVDSRWADPAAAPALLKLADLQSHAALLLGEWQPFDERDWSLQTCDVRIGDGPWQSFRGTHSLGAPTWALPAWLRHATRHGASVAAGTVVTAGTWSGCVDVKAGDRVEARFAGVGKAVVQF